jgi:hypothetical protein
LSGSAIASILAAMTKLLDKVLEAVSHLSPDEQDKIAREIMRLMQNDEEPEEIDPAHLPAVLEGLAQARRREFLTDEQVEELFRSFDS